MFDMATVLLGSHATNSSPHGKMLSCSPNSATSTATSSPTAHTASPTTPNHHHSIPITHQLHHHIHIKREPGLVSPVSGSENDMPPGHPGNPNNQSSPSSDCGSELFSAKCKRKINFSHLGIPPRGHQPATVARRNARERNRVKQVNNGFASLKQHIPLGHRAKKMSKVETLRCAVDYIRNLQGLLDPSGMLLGSAEGSSMDAFHQLFDFGGDGGSGSMSHTSTQQMSPTSSDDPSSPSYASEASYPNTSSNNAASQPSSGPNPNNPNMYDYENYEPVSPEDEELLDAISWWQQS